MRKRETTSSFNNLRDTPYKMGRADASHFEPHADRWHGKKEWENPVDNHYGYDMVAL